MKRFVSMWLRVSGVLLSSVVHLQAESSLPPPPVITDELYPPRFATEEALSASSTASSTESNRLWLEITGVANAGVHLILHGTEPFAEYELQSKAGLTNAWVHEMMLAGSEGVDATVFLVPMGGRTNELFFRACFHPTDDGAGLPLEHLQLWLKADAGVEQSGTNGAVSLWQDRSGHGNDASQASSTFRPLWVDSVVNGRPVLRFTPNNFLRLPDFLSTNVAGEVFVVLKATTNLPAINRTLWRFGQASGGYYPGAAGGGGYISASFGRTSTIADIGTPCQRVDRFHLYNAATEPGSWINRINGVTHYETSDTTVGFSSQPYLGYNASGTYFDGDIAEVMLFDRVLTAGERDDVGCYLNGKYQWVPLPPPAPRGLSAMVVASNQVSLEWTRTLAMETTVYAVERKVDDGGPFIVVAEVRDTTAHLDTEAKAATTYHYRIKARNHAGESAYSAQVSATTPGAGAGLPITDLQLWLKADVGVLRDGADDRVMIWQDQSGNEHHATQVASAAQPLWVRAGQNGRPAIRFDSGNDYLRLPDFLGTNTEAEVFAVLKTATNAPSGNRGLWQFGSAQGGYYPATPGAGGYISASFGRSVLVLNSGTPVQQLDTLHLYNAASGPGNWTSRINGAVHYSSAINTVGFTSSPFIGRNKPNNYPKYFDGDLVELMVFHRVLTPGERGAVSLYLNGRHEVVDLPCGVIALSAQTLSSSQIALSWSQQAANHAAVYTYTVERRTGTNGPFIGIAQVSGDTRYFDEESAAGTTYSYRVRNTFVTGADPSNEATATTLASGSPVPLDQIALWFRAEDLSLTNAEPIPNWMDFWNPTLAATQSDQALQPGWIASNLNGHASVEFGGGTCLELPSVLSNATAAEICVVLRSGTNAPAANQGLWRFNNNGATLFPDTNGIVQDAFGSTSTHHTLAPLPDLTKALLYSVSADSGLWQSRMNGPLKQWLTMNTVEFTGVPLLGRSTGGASEPFAGHIAELIVFNRVLTRGEQKSVRNGLALKYGLPLELPEIPDDLSLVRTVDRNSLMTWTALAGSENGLESHFVVERQADTNSPFVPITTLPRIETSYLDASGLPEIDYGYRLRAINDVGDVASSPLRARPTDSDRDGLTDVLETILGTDPNDSDTDTDGLPDDWEVAHGLNALRVDGIHGASGDLDGDGVSNLAEYQHGTNPTDGMEGDDPLIQLRVHRPN